jgi:hypothetical protein
LLSEDARQSIDRSVKWDRWRGFTAVTHSLNKKRNDKREQRGTGRNQLHRGDTCYECQRRDNETWNSNDMHEQVGSIKVKALISLPLPTEKTGAHDGES